MSDATLDERLRTLGQLYGALLERPDVKAERARLAREARRTAVTDMSPEGIDRRLRTLGSVSRLCASLARLRAAG